MPQLVTQPNLFPQKDITINEYFGRISSGQTQLSICRITSGAGWSEPRQRPEFDEYTIMISGELHLKSEDGSVTVVRAGEAVFVPKNESVQYSTPSEGGADYIAVCVPAFSMDLARRENSD